MKFKVIFAFVVIAMLMTSCRDENSNPLDNYSRLEFAYQTGSLPALQNILDEWSAAKKPITPSEYAVLSDTQKYVYDIFKVFYDPFNLEKYGAAPDTFSIIGNDYYKDVKYIFVQSEIGYKTGYDTLVPLDALQDFGPDLSHFPVKVIYNCSAYNKELSAFAGKYDENKRNFLESCIKVKWGYSYINPQTEPHISHINFNASLDSATVMFIKDWHLGETRFFKDGGDWKWIESKITDIVIETQPAEND